MIIVVQCDRRTSQLFSFVMFVYGVHGQYSSESESEYDEDDPERMLEVKGFEIDIPLKEYII